MRKLLPTMIVIMIVATNGNAAEPTTRPCSLYPNELDGFRIYERYCPTLEPMTSTVDDVKKVMGQPMEEKSGKWILWYEKDSWKILVYLFPDNDEYPAWLVGQKVESIDFIPATAIPFGEIEFPTAFRKAPVQAADAGWDEYADAHGLTYEVYTSKPPFGDEQRGDLNRISYRPAPQRIIQMQKFLIAALKGKKEAATRPATTALRQIKLTVGMKRVEAERLVAEATGIPSKYDIHAMDTSSEVTYRHGSDVLVVRFKPGSPSPLVRTPDGAAHLPPVDGEVLSWEFVNPQPAAASGTETITEEKAKTLAAPSVYAGDKKKDENVGDQMEKVLEGLVSADKRVQDRSVNALLSHRKAIIERLIPLVASDKYQSVAAYVLGEWRAVEAVPALSKALANPQDVGIGLDMDRYDHAVERALWEIGRPAVPAMITNIEETGSATLMKRSVNALFMVLGGKQHTLELLGKLKARAKDEKVIKRVEAAIEYTTRFFSGREPLY